MDSLDNAIETRAITTRPLAQRAFWLAGGAGLLAELVFVALASGGSVGGLRGADALLLCAVWLCGLGYAEGGAVSRELGGARTICWALVLSLPATTAVSAVAA